VASNIFVTAIDTDAGKTWVTAAAIGSLLQAGIAAKALKPIACGLDEYGHNEDIETLLAAQQLNHADQINCYRYALPAAPSQAAAAEQKTIDTEHLLRWCHQQSSHIETCLIEGVGGLMTPITDHWLVSDWIAAMPDYQIWLVVNCKLGAINQTLLTLDKLGHMGRMPERILFNATSETYNDWIAPTRNAVELFLNQDCTIHCLKYREKSEVVPIPWAI